MKRTRKQHRGACKAKVALEALKGARTLNELASHFEIHPPQIVQWKQRLLAGVAAGFHRGTDRDAAAAAALRTRLQREIGQLKVELDWLKKSLSCSREQRRQWIQPQHLRLSVRRQCQLLGLAPASYYYQAAPEAAENLAYMRWLDREYTERPCYVVRKLTQALQLLGPAVGPKRVRRLLRLMSLLAIQAQPRLRLNPGAHPRFPYLLKGVAVVRPNQVWSTDLTHIPLRGGFVFLAAILDWYSRSVLAWELSITREADFCVALLDFSHFLSLYALDKLPTSRRLRVMMNAFVFCVEGYDDDPREIHSIPEVGRFYAAFHEAWPDWLYFCNLEVDTLKAMVPCCLREITASKVDGRAGVGVQLDPLELLHFIAQDFLPMNLLYEREQMFERGIYDRTKRVFEYFDLPFDTPPPP